MRQKRNLSVPLLLIIFSPVFFLIHCKDNNSNTSKVTVSTAPQKENFCEIMENYVIFNYSNKYFMETISNLITKGEDMNKRCEFQWKETVNILITKLPFKCKFSGRFIDAALEKNDTSLLKLLLLNKVSIDSLSMKFMEPYALKLLFENGLAKSQFFEFDFPGMKWSPEMVKVCLAEGISPNEALGKNKANLFRNACNRGMQKDSLLKTTELLIKAGANINVDGGMAANNLACTSHNDEYLSVFKLLIENKLNPKVSPIGRGGLLENLAGGNNPGTIELLLKNGAPIKSNSDGVSPIYLAVGNLKPKEVEILLKYGANPDEKLYPGKYATPRKVALNNLELYQNQLPQKDSCQLILRLLEKK